MRRISFDLVSALLTALGVIALGLPFLLNWWIHGSYERYIWIINGPPPYDQFGGGPYQLWMHVQLVLLGIVLTGIGTLLRWRMWREFRDK